MTIDLAAVRGLLENPPRDVLLEFRELRLALYDLYEFVRNMQGVCNDRQIWWKSTPGSGGFVKYSLSADGLMDLRVEGLWWIPTDDASKMRVRLTRDDLQAMLDEYDR